MILGLRSWGSCVVFSAVVLVGCNVDPGGGASTFTQHCSELQGDATCQSTYVGRPNCSLCTDSNQGCVIVPPAVICQPDGGTGPLPETGSTSGGSASGSSTEGMNSTGLDSTGLDSTTGEPACEQDGQLDPGCMELDPERPFCADSVCVGCETAGGHEFCAGLDELAPACDEILGSCLPCDMVAAQACTGATPICAQTGACEVCTAHDQCPQSACHLGPDDALLGQCFAPDEVIYIDNQAPCPGLGTQDDPACSLQDTAATLVPGDVRVLRIAGGVPYAERADFDGEITVALIGEGGAEVSGAPGQQAATFIFDQGVTAYVSQLRINGNQLTHGVLCNMSYVQIEDSEIRDNDGWAVFDFEPCTLDLERTIMVGNEDGGVRLSGGELILHNSVVGLNGIGGNSSGVRIIDGNVDILYSTIAGNDGSGADSIECDGATGTLRNSIVFGADPVSLELDCFPLLMDNNALDAANFASGSNVEVGAYNPIFFNGPVEGDFTLSAPPLTPFIDVALWQDGDPELDGDGTPRPMGDVPGYAGVDEP